eukprot:jgi/Bigna1/128177/aug1.6_g2885
MYGARQLATVRDPEIKQILRKIILEECTHSILAWSACKWAVEKGGRSILAAVTNALASAMSRVKEPTQLQPSQDSREGKAVPEEESVWAKYGVLPEKTMRSIESNQGSKTIGKLLAALKASTSDQKKEEEGKGKQQWNPVEILLGAVNSLAGKRTILSCSSADPTPSPPHKKKRLHPSPPAL